jgi:rhamnosyltransferase
LNAGPDFDHLLQRLYEQRADFGYEVIVVDSGSTDGTAELAERHGAAVHRVPGTEFNHGATRNLGISLSSGRYVALLVQDATPLDDSWLAAMVDNLEQDESVAGVYSRQVPRPEHTPLARAQVNARATASLERREQFVGSRGEWDYLPPMKRRRLSGFDNVSSCIRRSVWREVPFEKTDFGEDLRWAKRAVEAGHKLVYEPRSVVVHSHERGALYDLRRHYVDGQILAELFGSGPVASLKRLLLGVPVATLRNYHLLHREHGASVSTPGLLLQSVGSVVPAQLGAYVGARSRSLRDSSPRLYRALDGFLSRGI